jgi:hypothetical protein
MALLILHQPVILILLGFAPQQHSLAFLFPSLSLPPLLFWSILWVAWQILIHLIEALSLVQACGSQLITYEPRSTMPQPIRPRNHTTTLRLSQPKVVVLLIVRIDRCTAGLKSLLRVTPLPVEKICREAHTSLTPGNIHLRLKFLMLAVYQLLKLILQNARPLF